MAHEQLKRRASESNMSCCPYFASENAHLPKVSSFGFDKRELALLEAIRHICCQYVNVDYSGTSLALKCVGVVWGAAQASGIVFGVSNLVRAIQRCRQAPFDFIGPGCENCSKHICYDELEVMLLLRCAVFQQIAQVNETARRVAGHEQCDEIAQSALELASGVRGELLPNRSISTSSSKTRH